MKLSYLVTCSTETKTLQTLFRRLYDYRNTDQIVIVHDSECPSKETSEIINIFSTRHPTICKYEHPLNADYGTHKNWGTKQCDGDYIFQIDGDELPSENILGENLHAIIESNPEVELIFVPRINDYKGVNEEHARQWGWRLTPSTSIIHEKIIDTESNEYKFLKNNGYILEESKIE